MRSSLLHSKKLVAIFVAACFVLSLGLSLVLAAEKTSDKKTAKVFQGADKMMEGKKMLMTGLSKQKLGKDPKLAAGIKALNEGDKMTVEGKKLMKAKEEKDKIKGQELVMSGTTKMMEGKDAIMKELKARGMMQEGKLQEGEKILQQGEMKMLEGKNDMERPLE